MLVSHEDDGLRLMESLIAPYANHEGKNDLYGATVRLNIPGDLPSAGAQRRAVACTTILPTHRQHGACARERLAALSR